MTEHEGNGDRMRISADGYAIEGAHEFLKRVVDIEFFE